MGFFGTDKKQDVEKEEDEEEETKDEEPATYEMSYDCDNCGGSGDYEVPFKTILKDFLKDKKCEDCGCDVL